MMKNDESIDLKYSGKPLSPPKYADFSLFSLKN